jgi:transketolase
MKRLSSRPPPESFPVGASFEDMKDIAAGLRYLILQLSHNAGTPHLASALSSVDILTAAYWRVLSIDPAKADAPDRDRLIFSKGHAAIALYAALGARGFFPESILDGYGLHGSPLAEQPAPFCAPGVELATGSLGHGLPVGVGMALASRLNRVPFNVIVVMGDGETNEGSVWEAALLAPALKLGNLCVVIDYNKWQATGRSNEVTALAPLADKWRAFGWETDEVDGHDIEALTRAMTHDPQTKKPRAVIAHTIKGKGVSFMEDDNNWHYRIPKAEELEKAKQELERR